MKHILLALSFLLTLTNNNTGAPFPQKAYAVLPDKPTCDTQAARMKALNPSITTDCTAM